MLVTTTKRPGHRTRILGRELANVILKSRYAPRGTKTVERVARLAGGLGHTRVMIIGSRMGKPKEFRFLEVGEGWRWAEHRILLGDVELQREIGRRTNLDAASICPEDKEAKEFAGLLSDLTAIPLANKPGGRACVLVNSEKVVQFWTGERNVGPKIFVEGVEKLQEGQKNG